MPTVEFSYWGSGNRPTGGVVDVYYTARVEGVDVDPEDIPTVAEVPALLEQPIRPRFMRGREFWVNKSALARMLGVPTREIVTVDLVEKEPDDD